MKSDSHQGFKQCFDALNASDFKWVPVFTGSKTHNLVFSLKIDGDIRLCTVPSIIKPTFSRLGILPIVTADHEGFEPESLHRTLSAFDLDGRQFNKTKLLNVTDDPALFYLHEMTLKWSNDGKAKDGNVPTALIDRAMELRKIKRQYPDKDVRVFYNDDGDYIKPHFTKAVGGAHYES